MKLNLSLSDSLLAVDALPVILVEDRVGLDLSKVRE
jgi:hypothetical protein